MKKIVVLLLMCVGAYVVYDKVIKEKEVLEINADKSISTSYSADIDAPALNPSKYGMVNGTVKNISDEAVTNISLKYKIDAQPVEARIDRLEPGEEKNFTTNRIMLKHSDPSFFLEDMSYE